MTKPSDKSKVSIRELVLEVLLEVTRDGVYSHVALSGVLEKYQYLEKQERSFITRVTEGTLERMIELDYIIDQFSKVKTRKMKPVIRNIMRSAVYQLKYMDSIPDSAVCNEAVKLAERKGFRTLKGFVNGVLRNISRNLDQVTWPSEDDDPVSALSVRYSVPEWIVRRFLRAYDAETVKKVLQAFLTDIPVTIRCNMKRTRPEELRTLIEQTGAKAEVSEYLSYALRITGYNYIKELPGYAQGLFQVQDVSSMLVGEIAGVKQGDCCIDVCASPGGKSLHLSELTGESGCVDARDISEQKLLRIRENVARMRADNVLVKVMDAVEFDEASEEKADILLVDAPCSGLGILGKKTDIKYNITESGQRELVRLQREILETVWKYVKKGGTLIYSTCTINSEENEENVRWFTEHFPFEPMDLNEVLPDQLKGGTAEQGYVQLLPGIHQSDGFFLSKMKRMG